MSDTRNTGGGTSGATWRNNPSASARAQQAYDPWLQPELFRGVLTRRVFAFLIDLVILSIPIILAVIFVTLFGIVTLGLGWFLFWLISPFSVIWALLYYGMSLGGPNGATVGMRMMDIEMRTWTGERPYFILGAVHAILYWVSVSFLSPLVLLVGLFNGRRRLLHDVVLGTVFINSNVQPSTVQTTRV